MMKRDPRLSKCMVTKLADAAELVWACGVVDSGYHNGAHCHPNNDHHDPSWGCGWYWKAKVRVRT